MLVPNDEKFEEMEHYIAEYIASQGLSVAATMTLFVSLTGQAIASLPEASDRKECLDKTIRMLPESVSVFEREGGCFKSHRMN